MAAEVRHFRLARGTDRDIVLTLVDGNDDPLDLTDATLHYRVARRASSMPLLLIDLADMLVDETDDGTQVTIPITAAQSGALTPYVYDQALYMIQNGVRSMLMRGTLTIWSAQVAGHGAA
jgi:hypothetical protein